MVVAVLLAGGSLGGCDSKWSLRRFQPLGSFRPRRGSATVMPARDACRWLDVDCAVKPPRWIQLPRLVGAPPGPCVFARRRSSLRRALVKLKGERAPNNGLLNFIFSSLCISISWPCLLCFRAAVPAAKCTADDWKLRRAVSAAGGCASSATRKRRRASTAQARVFRADVEQKATSVQPVLSGPLGD